jgi:hypothetical protein
MAFDGDLVLGVLRQPAGLALQHGALITPHRQVRNVESGSWVQVDLAAATNLAIVSMKTIIIAGVHFLGPIF